MHSKKNEKMPKAVLFDLDQTLIDFFRMKREASKKAANAMIKAGLRLDKRTAGKKLFDFATCPRSFGDFSKNRHGGLQGGVGLRPSS